MGDSYSRLMGNSRRFASFVCFVDSPPAGGVRSAKRGGTPEGCCSVAANVAVRSGG
jgi:hypothetical protein